MIRREELIEIGCYNKPHGINGEISATFDYELDTIMDNDCFITCINGIFVPFFTENFRTKNNSTALLKIEGMDDENSVKILVNQKIYALKTSFKQSLDDIDEDDEELPLDYFIGFSVVTDEDTTLGEIEEVDCSTENFLFIINHGEKQVYIPATDDFITDIDFERKILTMSLPQGILEL